MVRRVYVEKKPEYAVQAKDLFHEIKSYLGIKDSHQREGADPLRRGEHFGGDF